MKNTADKFTSGQKAGMVEGAQFAHARPKADPGVYDFRADFLAQLTKAAQRRAAEEMSGEKAGAPR